METLYCTSPDGARIAYDVTGGEPPLLLLHGGGGLYDRRMWHKAGYVRRLAESFRVITLDLRGNGESDHPTTVDAYAIGAVCQDVYTVADACQADDFLVWGFSYGANIARTLAAESDCVQRVVMTGVGFGPAVTPTFSRWIDDYAAKWGPILEALAGGELDPASLPEKDQKVLCHANVACWYPCFQAMKRWPTVRPGDLRCPAMVLVGTKNKKVYAGLEADRVSISAAGVHVQVLEGFTHQQEFSKIDGVLPLVLPFLSTV